MNEICVAGLGAVSPAGWGVQPMREALLRGEPVPCRDLIRPGWERPLRTRQVPKPPARPEFMSHPRLRRASPIGHYAVGAALEALGGDRAKIAARPDRFGILLCVMAGCVNYSRRFYNEVLENPATASPLIFPETVFNAPASHLAAVLGAMGMNYCLVGDPGTFLQGLALAAEWIASDRLEGCVVVGAEEIDWLTADAMRLFARPIVLAEGAAAVYLRRGARRQPVVRMHSVTDSHLFLQTASRTDAAKRMRRQLPPCASGHLLCDGRQGLARGDAAEARAWADWRGSRMAPKTVLGEGLMAAAGWQCAAAIDALEQRRYSAANVSIVGCNQQAIGAHWVVESSARGVERAEPG